MDLLLPVTQRITRLTDGRKQTLHYCRQLNQTEEPKIDYGKTNARTLVQIFLKIWHLLCTEECVYPVLPPRARCDTRSISKRCTRGLNSEFSFLRAVYLTKAREPSLPSSLPIHGRRRDRFMSCINFRDEACWFLSLRVFGLWRNGYRRWFPRLLKRQPSGGCRFNPHYRRVTIQEYLTLVPGYRQRNQNRRPSWFQ